MPDPVLGTQLFWERNKVAIIAALALIVLGLVAFGVYRYQAAKRDAAAAELLAEAKVAANYQKLIEQYPSAPATASAYLLLATEERKATKFAEANETLQKFVAKFPKHELISTAKMAMAGNLDSLGKPDEAVEGYRKLAADYPRDFNAPLALLAEAQLLRHKGQIDEARRVCETILTQYRDSVASTEASSLLRRLKPSASAETPAAAPVSSVPAASVTPAASSVSSTPAPAATGASVPAIVSSPAASTAPTP